MTGTPGDRSGPARSWAGEDVMFGSTGRPGRRGLALVGGFWVVITAILAARVALFDEIAGREVGRFVSTQLAALSSVLF